MKKICLLLFLFPYAAYGWSDHTVTTYYALEEVHSIQLQQQVVTETLQHFLQEMQSKHPGELPKAIDQAENWAKKNLPGYHPRPQNITYTESVPSQFNFLQGIRINPNSQLFPYVRDMPPAIQAKYPSLNDIFQPKNEFPYTKVTLKQIGNSNVTGLHYFSLSSNHLLPALVVLATAADEPDLGLDLGLFQDDNSQMANTYGFGKQPFGDPRVGFSSQAPFHYGAYHEWKILSTLAPQTKECYSAYRIKLYRELAKAAFRAGHPYWGWRFLGFGLHYIQDITQPYHAHYFPGFNTLRMIIYYGLSIIHIKKPLQNTINLVANRHFLLEDFVKSLLKADSNPGALTLQESLSQIQEGENEERYDDSYPQEVISATSSALSDELSRTLLQSFPFQFTSDPDFLYEERKENVLNNFESLKAEKKEELLDAVGEVLRETGAETRIYLQEFL